MLSYSGYHADQMTREYFASPQVGDLYEYRTLEADKNQYTTFRVFAVSKETLYVLENMYSSNKPTSFDILNSPAKYDTTLKKIYKKGDILETRIV